MPDPRADIIPLLPYLRAFAQGLTHGDTDLADDLVQDTVVLALGHWHQFTPGTNLKSWLFTILRNRFRTVAARRKFMPEALPDDIERRLVTPATHDNGLVMAEFKRAFAKLSPVHREMLILTSVHHVPYEDVAAIMGCEVGTVKSRVSRARALLKAMLLGDAAPAKAAEPQRSVEHTVGSGQTPFAAA